MRWVVLIAAVLVGCDGDPPDPVDASTDAAQVDAAIDAAMDDGSLPDPDGAMRDAGLPPRVEGCFDGAVDVAVASGVATARSPHYEVEAQADEETAESYARTLEAAWEEYRRFFDGEPALAAGERLRVRFFGDRARYEAGLADDGLAGVGGSGGYYEPSNRTAYLFDQPTRYFTRMLLLHEAGHQFHWLTRTRSGAVPFWYGEGVAEYLSRHDWDGRCVRLGVRPLVTQEDSPAQALSMLEGGGVSMAGLVDESFAATRPIAHAAFRYFGHVDGGAREPAFRRFRAAVDGGADIPTAFAAELGAPASHDGPWLPFLRADQEPMSTVFLEHAHVSETSLDAFSDFFSIAIVKVPVVRFDTSFAVPAVSGWSGGVVLGYESPTRFEALVVRDSGRLQRFDVDGGAVWNDVGPAPAAMDGRYRFAVEHSAGRVTVTINGETQGFDTSLPAISGPAIDAAALRFEEIAWE